MSNNYSVDGGYWTLFPCYSTKSRGWWIIFNLFTISFIIFIKKPNPYIRVFIMFHSFDHCGTNDSSKPPLNFLLYMFWLGLFISFVICLRVFYDSYQVLVMVELGLVPATEVRFLVLNLDFKRLVPLAFWIKSNSCIYTLFRFLLLVFAHVSYDKNHTRIYQIIYL